MRLGPKPRFGVATALTGQKPAMPTPALPPGPTSHSEQGGVTIGSSNARKALVVYEDAQCPFCKQFEDACGDLLSREIASGSVRVEYRIRSFLGEESVRAANALALGAEAGHFDELRREIFANQPPEHSGGFTADELIELGERANIRDSAYNQGVREGVYDEWVRATDAAFEAEEPNGTPNARLDGVAVDQQSLYDPRLLGDLIRR